MSESFSSAICATTDGYMLSQHLEGFSPPLSAQQQNIYNLTRLRCSRACVLKPNCWLSVHPDAPQTAWFTVGFLPKAYSFRRYRARFKRMRQKWPNGRRDGQVVSFRPSEWVCEAALGLFSSPERLSRRVWSSSQDTEVCIVHQGRAELHNINNSRLLAKLHLQGIWLHSYSW